MLNMLEKQKEICQKYGSLFEPLTENETLIFAGTDFTQFPIIGCRVEDWTDDGKSFARWFISCGEVLEDCPEHELSVPQVEEKLPQILPFLALSKGFNFIIDEENEVDVWFDD